MDIPQIREPGRVSPYITIVDTGLAVFIANLLAGLSLYHAEGELEIEDWMEKIEIANNALALEIEQRTF